MNMKLFASAALAAGLALATASTSHATAMVLGSGWQTDEVDAPATASSASPLTVHLDPGQAAQFSLTDAFNVGDTYTITINGALVFTSFIGITATPFNNNTGPYASFYAPAWLDISFQHFAVQFGPGDWSFVVTGDCVGGCPAGFGYRLDSLGVPEPAAWALMLMGFGLVGATLRGGRRQALAA